MRSIIHAKESSMKPALMIAFPIPSPVIERAQQEFDVVHTDIEISTEQIIRIATEKQVRAIMVSMGQKITQSVLDQLPPSLKIIATSSVGYDHFDLKAAQNKGIQLTNTPDVLTDSTADFTLLLILSACRRAPEYTEIMNKGWGTRFGQDEMLGTEVTGKTLGILGMGRIGQAVAKRARGFGIKILYNSPRRLSPELELDATYFSDFKKMLPHCEILSLHAPARATTAQIMNTETFSLLPAQSIFINTARGSLVDEEALIQALRSKHLFAAGLDVFQNEPHFDTRFLEFPNVVLAPHMGSATLETRIAMGLRALENIRSSLSGQRPRDLLTS
jgi:hydroxypyruvate reductase